MSNKAEPLTREQAACLLEALNDIGMDVDELDEHNAELADAIQALADIASDDN